MATVKGKKLVLAFPPMTMPTGAPLGVSMLKGYLNKELPEWEVKALDLNLAFFRLLFTALASGEISLPASTLKELGTDINTLLRAANTFLGEDDDTFYNKPETYDLYASVFLNFTNIFVKYLHDECDKWEKGGDLTPFLKALVDHIMVEKPDVVGISMIFSEQLPVGAMLGRYIRNEYGIKVLFGGSCFIEGAEHFLKWYPEAADIIVIGDGEMSLVELLKNDLNPEGIAGALYLDENKVLKTPPVYHAKIDDFGMPDFSDFNLHAYFSPEPVVPLLLTRGCYWRKCTFCVHYFSAGDTYRMHSLDRMIELLTNLTDQGINNFSFVDEMIAPQHFYRFAQAVNEAKLDINYYALSKPNATFTEKVMQELGKSGCKYLLWGLESGNQRVLDIIGKGTKTSEIPLVLKRAHDAGVANHLYVMCGFPTETVQEYTDTLRFLNDNRDYIYATHRGVFGLEIGSPVYKNPEKFSITETWVHKRNPLGGRIGYKTSEGMSMEEAYESFRKSIPLLRAFNPYSRQLDNFRDHALLIYKHKREELHPEKRNFPSLVIGKQDTNLITSDQLIAG